MKRIRQIFSTPRLLLLLAVGLAGCAINPLTGQRQFVLISESQEIEIGEQTAAQVVKSIGLVPDSGLQQYVETLGQRMARDTERPDLPWSFQVMDDPTPNAFAMPGGKIFFTRGLLALLDDEAQFAAVLGHEIAHVTARHSVAALTRAQVAQIGLGIGTALVPELEPLGSLAAAGLELLFLRHSREAEREADEHGFRYTLQQGYDAGAMVEVFEVLRRLGDAGNRSALPGWLLTHPTPEERVETARSKAAGIQDRSSLRIGREDYLQRLEGLVYGDNPRQGFFENNTFLHPDLEFRLDLPTGWNTQNMARAVVASTPENDAVLQLTLEEGPAAETAQGFLANPNVTSTGARRQTINGNPSLVATFQAQAEEETLAGMAAWIDFDGRTYQLLGITPEAAFPSHRGAFQQTLNSFRRLTDARVLAVQPDKIRLIRLTEDMSLARFHERFPSTISLEELAIVNQIESPGTIIPAGRLVKQVAQ